MAGKGGGKKAAPKARAQSRGAAFVPLSRRAITPAERRRRLLQSRRDKALQMGGGASYTTQATGRVGYKAPVPRARRSGGGGGSRLQQHLALLRKTLPFSAPTRRESIHFRSSITLKKGQAPVFLFHPSRSTAAWVVTGRDVNIVYADIDKRIQDHVQGNALVPTAPAPVSTTGGVISTDPSAPPVFNGAQPQPGGFYHSSSEDWTHWWVDNKVIRPESGTSANFQSLNYTHEDVMIAQGIGTPHDLFSEGIRCLGGIAAMTIQCGPTIRGFLHYRIVTGPELFAYSSQMIVSELASPYFHRRALRPGVQTLHWHAPVENPAALEVFGPHSSAFHNLHGGDLIEPFSAVVYTFSAVDWAANDSAPLVSFSSCVNLQCTLPPSVRHLATKEQKTSRDELTKHYSQSTSGELEGAAMGLGGLAQMVEFGMARAAPVAEAVGAII